jgi:hypothetical protein
LSIIEPKKAAIYNREYIHINESFEKNAKWEINSRIEYETDQIKVENSDLTTHRNLVYVLSFVTLLGLSIYTINPEN